MIENGLTDTEFYDKAQAFIEQVYSELDQYEVVLGEDFLSTGVTRFLTMLNKSRQWGSRVLQMQMDARRLRNRVSFIARGKKTLFEHACIRYVRDKRDSMPKGLSADERKSLAAMECTDLKEEHEKWELLASELRSSIEILQEKHRELLSAKQDLRAQLWAVKLQGMLGELGQEAAIEDPAHQHWMQQAPNAPGKNAAPSFAEGDEKAKQIQTSSQDLDNLLG